MFAEFFELQIPPEVCCNSLQNTGFHICQNQRACIVRAASPLESSRSKSRWQGCNMLPGASLMLLFLSRSWNARRSYACKTFFGCTETCMPTKHAVPCSMHWDTKKRSRTCWTNDYHNLWNARERERKRKTSSLLIWFQTFKDSPSQPATQVAFTKSSQPLSKKERPLHRQFYQGMFARVSVIHCSLKEIEQVLNGREWWKQWKRKPSSNLMNGPAIVRSQEEDQGPHAWIWCMMYDVCMDVCM